jgi:hypothetical protein
MTEQNRKYITKEIGKLLSEIWRIKGRSEQEYGMDHPITKKLIRQHDDVQALLWVELTHNYHLRSKLKILQERIDVFKFDIRW